jgi:hypothetical protein
MHVSPGMERSDSGFDPSASSARRTLSLTSVGVPSMEKSPQPVTHASRVGGYHPEIDGSARRRRQIPHAESVGYQG